MEQTPQPGWYPDPEYQRYQRYWDGQQWTDDRAPDVPPAAPVHFMEVHDRLAQTRPAKAFVWGLQIVRVIGLVLLTGVAVGAIVVLLATRN